MNVVSRFSFQCLLGFCCASPCRSGDISGWVTQLGAESFAEREAASLALWSLGEPTLEELRAATKHPDPEVRLRAVELVENIEMGLQPSWPEALCKRVKAYRSLPNDKRKDFLRELATAEQGLALPFLLHRIRGGEADADTAVLLVQGLLDAAGHRAWITARIREPGNAREAKLLVKIMIRQDSALEDLSPLLSSPHLMSTDKEELVGHMINQSIAWLNRQKYADLEKRSAEWMAADPNELRFAYLRAVALAHLGREEESTALCAKALALDPNSEMAHYHAADLLEDLNQDDLALAEWHRVLKAPSDDEMYDITAHMRMGRIHALKESYSLAVDAYETGLQKYREARARGAGAFVMSITEAELEERIANLREKSLEARKTKEGVNVSAVRSIKNDGEAELGRMKQKAECRVAMNIQPYGTRFFDNANATLAYDVRQKKLQVLLNGTPGNQSVSATFKSEKPIVAVQTLDMWFFFEMNLAENSSRLIASFEMDYVLHFTPSPRLAAWDSPGMSVNGTFHTWKELEDGIPFDFLPETIIMEIKGRTPEGKESSVRMETDSSSLRRQKNNP